MLPLDLAVGLRMVERGEARLDTMLFEHLLKPHGLRATPRSASAWAHRLHLLNSSKPAPSTSIIDAFSRYVLAFGSLDKRKLNSACRRLSKKTSPSRLIRMKGTSAACFFDCVAAARSSPSGRRLHCMRQRPQLGGWSVSKPRKWILENSIHYYVNLNTAYSVGSGSYCIRVDKYRF